MEDGIIGPHVPPLRHDRPWEESERGDAYLDVIHRLGPKIASTWLRVDVRDTAAESPVTWRAFGEGARSERSLDHIACGAWRNTLTDLARQGRCLTSDHYPLAATVQ